MLADSCRDAEPLAVREHDQINTPYALIALFPEGDKPLSRGGVVEML